MKNITLGQIAQACKGRYVGPDNLLSQKISGVTIDSRKVKEGYVFVAIVGERSDGHDFAESAVQNGALCCISEKELPENVPYILVKSSAAALQDAARYYRSTLDIKIVGITGSVGKTSTKEMVSSVVSQKYATLKTEGNYNNELGLPLTIFNIEDYHRVAVLEMGISDFGEMNLLAGIAKPDICVITNIGLCHLETLKSRDGILKAKSEIFDFITPDAGIVLNGDDDKLVNITDIKGIRPYTFGIDNTGADIVATDIENKGLEGVSCELSFGDTVTKVNIPIPGKHMVYNAMAGFLVGKLLGLTEQEIVNGIASLTPVTGRNNIINTGKIIVIDDCYNANPVSMKASIDVLDDARGRRVCILGDMFELGENEAELHRSVGEHLAQKNIEVLICVGALSANIAAAAAKNQNMQVIHFDTREELLANLKNIVKQGDNVLVKASHGMGFDEVVKELQIWYQ